jgi:hypothetical protein
MGSIGKIGRGEGAQVFLIVSKKSTANIVTCSNFFLLVNDRHAASPKFHGVTN